MTNPADKPRSEKICHQTRYGNPHCPCVHCQNGDVKNCPDCLNTPSAERRAKEVAEIIANNFIAAWPKMGPSARWINLRTMVLEAMQESRDEALEEAADEVRSYLFENGQSTALLDLANRIESLKTKAREGA